MLNQNFDFLLVYHSHHGCVCITFEFMNVKIPKLEPFPEFQLLLLYLAKVL